MTNYEVTGVVNQIIVTGSISYSTVPGLRIDGGTPTSSGVDMDGGSL